MIYIYLEITASNINLQIFISSWTRVSKHVTDGLELAAGVPLTAVSDHGQGIRGHTVHVV